jgi:hypothetical protein
MHDEGLKGNELLMFLRRKTAPVVGDEKEADLHAPTAADIAEAIKNLPPSVKNEKGPEASSSVSPPNPTVDQHEFEDPILPQTSVDVKILRRT